MKVAGQVILRNIFLVLTLFSGHYASAGDLIWPIDCKPGDDTCYANIGYPDIEGDGVAFNCGSPGYTGHHGTDISLTSSANLEDGVSVLAAADGVVEWVFDGKYDQCPDATNLDCQAPPNGWFEPGQSNGYRVCTDAGNYCNTGDCCCYWCFDGGNVVVIRHTGVEGVFATRYDHLKVNSILVSPGETVNAGQKIAEVGSAGNSTGPHLHFEVWGSGFYDLVDPWAGACGPNTTNSLWKFDIPWEDPTTISNIAPVADAGSDESLTACEEVVLNGENSVDTDGEISSFEWIITPTPTGSSDVMYRSGEVVSLGILPSGNYSIALTVTDDFGDVGTDEKSVIVNGHNEWDVNNDCKQGIEEVIYILKSLTAQ